MNGMDSTTRTALRREVNNRRRIRLGLCLGCGRKVSAQKRAQGSSYCTLDCERGGRAVRRVPNNFGASGSRHATRWSNDGILVAIRHFHAQFGDWPSRYAWDRTPMAVASPSSNTVVARFGSWAKAVEAAKAA